MIKRQNNVWLRKAAIASILPFAAVGLVGCNSTSGSEEGTDVEDVVEEENADSAYAYDGAYDTAFYEDYDSLIGEEVVLSADVNEVISNSSFTIAGTDDTSVEPLLVVSSEQMSEVTSGLTVEVTGTVKESFDLPTVEEELGIDLDDELYEDWDGENYIQASQVDTSVDADS